jgi:UDP-2,4-diacetamido-2,4,6-trideoxy-beta-L-altropyranose hydrolase
MKIAIRADSSWSIGTGHVMRCLALAHVLRERNAEVTFVCRELPGDIRSTIAANGFALATLASQTGSAVDSAADAAYTISAIGHADWIVVDHYGLDAAWERSVRSSASQIFVIDDLANREHDADLLLDQNFHPASSHRYIALVSPECQLLMGPRYALLRSEFASARARVSARPGAVKNIVVSFGGSDPSGMTLRAIDALQNIPLGTARVDIIAGLANPRITEIQQRAGKNGFQCHPSADVAALFSSADLAIGAGGGTSWERACLGVPSIIVALADNQEPGGSALGTSGYGLYLGRAEDLTDAELQSSISTLLHNESLRHFFSMHSMELVDGKGVDRVVRAMMPVAVTLRLAMEADSQNVHRWRNAEHVRLASLDQREIPWEQHERWFHASLENPTRALMIAEHANDPVGVLRYDFCGEQATVSIYLVGSNAGKGFGPSILTAGNRWMRENHPEIENVLAEIREENQASHSAFLNAGYRPKTRTYDYSLRRSQVLTEVTQ